MKSIYKTVLVGHSTLEMFNLIKDIESYPVFLPWCGGVEILNVTEENMEAKIHINFNGVKQFFHTINEQKSPTLIEMKYVDGPFKEFQGKWELQALSEKACKIQFTLSYEFSNRFLEKIIGPVFDIILNTFVQSFVKRADAVYL
ncbi:MAG: type II toxin-antitoxin system RatA family toxin [Betaproteobacteria bacterium]|jgi:ribosome-associated toxin RatA of RatAB toxin-antitoxin module